MSIAASGELEAPIRAVATSLDRAHERGSLGEREHGEIRRRVTEVATLDDLDDLVRSHPCLDTAFCRYPRCFRPRRTAVGGGKPPAYCADGVDEQGRPHTAATAHRRRRRTAPHPSAPAGPHAARGEDRPYTVAKATVSIRIEELLRAFGALSAEVAALESTYRSLGDNETREAEIESVRVEAHRRVNEAEAARLDAERDARELREAARLLTVRLEEADAAAEQNAHAADLAAVERDRAAENARIAERDTAAAIEGATAIARWLVAEAHHLAAETTRWAASRHGGPGAALDHGETPGAREPADIARTPRRTGLGESGLTRRRAPRRGANTVRAPGRLGVRRQPRT
ncbi:hypothetical protein [Nocardia bovistercoris]|uniref:Uncharacterized protein n=1 Tax=Nocardia bovistercoris TaxID=2785916 RepID=A0A931IDF3_9NOCA|nr:hypothetical protein [Nocardia bovistercoris]MBH0779409.1 hypothetical protein [Nocardia bovistercoris]